jgi:hypothetical protein
MKIDVFHCLPHHFQRTLVTRQMTMLTGTVYHCDDATPYRDAEMMLVLDHVSVMKLVSFRDALMGMMSVDVMIAVCDDCDAIVVVDNFVVVVVVEVDKLTTFVPSRFVTLRVTLVDSVDVPADLVN